MKLVRFMVGVPLQDVAVEGLCHGMLEKLFEYTPDELAHILSLETLNLLQGMNIMQGAQEAAFVLVATKLSAGSLSEEETKEAVDKVKLYMTTTNTQAS